MKKYFYLLTFFLFSASLGFSQIDSAAVVRGFYKSHGWSGIYAQITESEKEVTIVNPAKPVEKAVDNAVSPPSDLPLTTVQWAESSFDFGKINNVDSVKHVYKFKNTGTNPLKISNVKPACGCTAGSFSQNEIAPGAEGFVELKFSPVGKAGLQSKSATVLLNTDPSIQTLTFRAEIAE